MSDLKSLEELNALLENPIEVQPKKKLVDTKNKHASVDNRIVHKFAAEMNIKEGPVKVPTYVLFYLFVVWCRKTYRQPCGNTEFFRTFRRYCRALRTGAQRKYAINEDNNLKLTIEIYEKAKKYSKKSKKESSSKQEPQSPVET